MKKRIQTEHLVLIFLMLLLTAAIVSTAKADSSIDPILQIYFVTDLDQAGSIDLKRSYSSASTFRGHFGTGWCSELDARIRIYADHEIRYRGCDLETAAALDQRTAARAVLRGNFGFRRLREDGATQIFSREGFLDRIVRPDADIRIRRDDRGRPRELQIRARNFGAQQKVMITTIDDADSEDPDLLLVSMIDQVVFQYKDAMLTKTNGSRFSYDDNLNMTLRLRGGLSEVIEYEKKEDRVSRITRSATFGRDRLLLAIVRTGKSIEAGIELKVEKVNEGERGAEMHPVRILYNRETHRLSLEGDRDVARMILKWLRT